MSSARNDCDTLKQCDTSRLLAVTTRNLVASARSLSKASLRRSLPRWSSALSRHRWVWPAKLMESTSNSLKRSRVKRTLVSERGLTCYSTLFIGGYTQSCTKAVSELLSVVKITRPLPLLYARCCVLLQWLRVASKSATILARCSSHGRSSSIDEYFEVSYWHTITFGLHGEMLRRINPSGLETFKYFQRN